jgi:hypothetical protein
MLLDCSPRLNGVLPVRYRVPYTRNCQQRWEESDNLRLRLSQGRFHPHAAYDQRRRVVSIQDHGRG